MTTIASIDRPVARAGGMTRKRYDRPPIAEAYIDVQASYRQEPTLDQLAAFGSTIESRYPIRENMYSVMINADVKNGTMVTDQRLVGYRYLSPNREVVVQARTTGMLLSRLPKPPELPYDSWEDSLAETQRLWQLYCQHLKPTQVNRLTVRYVNQIDIPEHQVELTEYFTARPELPDSIPLAVQRFIMRLEVPLPNIPNGLLVVSQGTLPVEREDMVRVVLDLDLSRPVTIACGADESSMWDMLQELHDEENELFEAFCTKRAKELWDDTARA